MILTTVVINGTVERMRLLATACAVTVCTAVATLGTAGCGGADNASSDGRLQVIAAFYPAQFLAERIGGDRVSVTNLVGQGVEPHELELKPRQAAAVGDADLVIHVAGFQPALDDAIGDGNQKRAFDLADGQTLLNATESTGESPDAHGDDTTRRDAAANTGKDLHIWLDPARFAAIGASLADRLATIDGTAAATFRERADTLRSELTKLDDEYRAGLANCQRREIVTSHAAFGYLAARYNLTQIPISGLSPEDEPTPAHIAEVAALAREKGATTIFFETLVSPKIAETLAREVGARTEVLDPLEGITSGSGADYFSVMRENLTKLRVGLGCQ